MLPGSSNKFKFLHLLNYSLLTGIDFLYFGSVDQVWGIFNRLVGELGSNTFYCFHKFPTQCKLDEVLLKMYMLGTGALLVTISLLSNYYNEE